MKKRYYLIDAFRGASVITMIAYHLLWDLVYIENVSMPWFESQSGYILQRSIRWAFILLAGFCASMGKHPVKRGLVLLACSAVVTGVSYLAESPIVFGVLTFLGVATLFSALWRKLTRDRVQPVWLSCLGVVVCLGLFLATIDLEIGYCLGRAVPRSWYANDLTAFLGMPPVSFWSEDYVPLLPWIFAYGVGAQLYQLFARCNWLELFSKFRIRFLEFVGRHSLLIYLAHQPILYGLFFLI